MEDRFSIRRYHISWRIVDKYAPDYVTDDETYFTLEIKQGNEMLVSMRMNHTLADDIYGDVIVSAHDIYMFPLQLKASKGDRSVELVYPEHPADIAIKEYYATERVLFKDINDTAKTTLFWDIREAALAKLSDGKEEIPIRRKGSRTVYLDETTTYNLDVVAYDGSSTNQSLRIYVYNNQDVSFKAQPIPNKDHSFLLKWKVKKAWWVYLDDEKVQLEDERIIEVTDETTVTLKIGNGAGEFVRLYSIKLSPSSQVPSYLPVRVK